MNNIYFIRPYKPEDKNFILATFLRGLYYGNEFYNMIPKKIFMDAYKIALANLIQLPGVDIKVACLVEDPDTIIGYGIFKADSVHWLYIKENFRKFGIAKAVVGPVIPKKASHFSTLGLSLMKKHNIIFDPFNI